MKIGFMHLIWDEILLRLLLFPEESPVACALVSDV